MKRLLQKALSLYVVFSLLWGSFPAMALAEELEEALPTATAEITPGPTPDPAPKATAEPTATPGPTATPEPTNTPGPTPMPEPTAEATAGTQTTLPPVDTATPQATAALEVTATAEVTATPDMAALPEATATPEASLQPEESLSLLSSMELETPAIPWLEGFELSLEEEGIVVTGYTGADSFVTVPANVGEWPVTAIATGAFADNDTLTSVEVAQGILRLENRAFDNCPALEHLALPASLTYIASGAVQDCPLVVISAPGGSVAADFAAAYAAERVDDSPPEEPEEPSGEEYGDFGLCFRVESDIGCGMPAALFGGEYINSFDASLFLAEGTQLDGFTVLEFESRTPDILEVEWKAEGERVRFRLFPRDIGRAQLFISLQDNRDVIYEQDFFIDLEELPYVWEQPILKVNGLTDDNELIVGLNEAFCVDYTLEGPNAEKFMDYVALSPNMEHHERYFQDLGPTRKSITAPGTYPVQLCAGYRNLRVFNFFFIVVKDADGSMPPRPLEDEFYFTQNVTPLYFAPACAKEIRIGEVQLAYGSSYEASQVNYHLEFLDEGEPSAQMRLEEGADYQSDSYRALLVRPNPEGAPGISRYRLIATIQEEGQAPVRFGKELMVDMQEINTSQLPGSPLTLTDHEIRLSYEPGRTKYDVSWPGIVLPEGKAFPEGSHFDFYVVESDGNWYPLSDLREEAAWEAIISGQRFPGTHYASGGPRVFDLRYVVNKGNLYWYGEFMLYHGVNPNDASLLFRVNTPGEMYFGQGAECEVWLGSFRSDLELNVQDYGFELLEGDDVLSGVSVYTDDDYDHGGQVYTEIGMNGRILGLGRAVIRLWVQVDGTVYSRDIAYEVKEPPRELPTDLTPVGGDVLTVKAGERFSLPRMEEDLESLGCAWYHRLYIQNDGQRLRDNGIRGAHDLCGDTEFWVEESGRYPLVYEFRAGGNYCIRKMMTLRVTNEEGSMPSTQVLLRTDQRRTWVPTLTGSDNGDTIYELGAAYAHGVQLLETDREEWTWTIEPGSTGRFVSLETTDLFRGNGHEASRMVLQGIYPVEPGFVTLKVHYEAFDEDNNLIYSSDDAKTNYWTFELRDSYVKPKLRFQGMTEYAADENGRVRVNALQPSFDGMDEVEGFEPFSSSFYFVSGPDLDTARMNPFGDGMEDSGCDIDLNPDKPGTYVLCQRVWSGTVGYDLYGVGRIRIIVGGEEHAGVSIRAENRYPLTVSKQCDGLTIPGDFYPQGVVLGDELTWTIQRTSGTSADMVIYADHSYCTRQLTATVGPDNDKPRVRLSVVDCSDVGQSSFRLSLKVDTSDGKTFTAETEFAVNVVDDMALPTLHAEQTFYEIKAGESFTIPQPDITLPEGVDEEQVNRFWSVDPGVYNYTCFDEDEGKLNLNLYALQPGCYSARFCALLGLAITAVDYQIVVGKPSGSPRLLLKDPSGGNISDLNATLCSDPGLWGCIGYAVLEGAVFAPEDEIAFRAENLSSGSNIQVSLAQHTRTSCQVRALYRQDCKPTEMFQLTVTRNGEEVAHTSFILSSPTAIIGVEEITLHHEGPDTLLGLGSTQFTAIVYPSDAEDPSVVWSVSPVDAATVDDTGMVTALDITATTTLYVTAASVSNPGVRAAYELMLVPRIQSITVTAGTTQMSEGQTLQLTAATSPADASDQVEWSRADPTAASVDKNGLVTAQRVDIAREVTITATANDGSRDASGNLVTGTYNVTVCPITTGIALAVKDTLGADSTRISLDAADKTLRIHPQLSPMTASQDLTWEVNDRTILTLDADNDGQMDRDPENGSVIVTGLLPGQTTVTVIARDGSGITATTGVIQVVKDPTPIGDHGSITLSVGMTSQIDAAAISETCLSGKPITGYSVAYDGKTETSKGVKVSSSGLITVEARVSNAVITLITADPLVFAHIHVMVTDAPDDLLLTFSSGLIDDALEFDRLGSKVTMTVNGKAGGLDVPAMLTAASANTAVVSVTQTAADTFDLTAIALGHTDIIVRTHNGISKTVSVNVDQAFCEVILTSPGTVYAGKSASIGVTYVPRDVSGKALDWDWEPVREEDAQGFDPSLVKQTHNSLTVGSKLDRVLDITVSATYIGNTGASNRTARCTVTLVPLVSNVTIGKGSSPLTTLVSGVHVVNIRNLEDPIQLVATLKPSGVEEYARLQWASSVPSVASVKDGLVTVHKTGDTVITATAQDGSKAKGTFKLSVRDMVEDITITETTAFGGELIAGAARKLKLAAACLPLSATNKTVDWSVDPATPFVSVTSAGVVTVRADFTGDEQRTATIIATARDGSGTMGTFDVTVFPAVTGLQITDVGDQHLSDPACNLRFDLSTPGVIAAEGKLPLVCFVAPEEAKQEIVWKSSNPSQVKTVQIGDGYFAQLLKPTGAAGVTLTATSAVNKAKLDRVTLFASSTLPNKPVSVSIDGTNTLVAGKSHQFIATVWPAHAQNKAVTWTLCSEDGSLIPLTSDSAAIDPKKGVLKALVSDSATPQTVYVKAVCAETNHAGDPVESEPFAVTVYQKSAAVVISSNDPDEGEEGGKPEGKYFIDIDSKENILQLYAAVNPSSAMPSVTWSSSSSKVAVVDKNTGLVTAKGVGTATITATTNDGLKKKKSCTVTVGVMLKKLTLTVPDTTLPAKGKTTVKATYEPIYTTTRKVSWKSSDTSVATVSSAGVVTAKTVRQSSRVTITATALDGSGVTGERELWVRPLAKKVRLVDESGRILPDKLTLDMNRGETTLELGAMCLSDNEEDGDPSGEALQGVSWSSSKTAVAKVDQNGLVTAVSQGKAVITATATDGSKKSAKVTLDVQCKPESVTISGSPDVAYGKSVKLAALVGPAGVASQTVAWKLAGTQDKNLATISSTNGTVTAKNVKGNIGATIHVIATTKSAGLDGVAVSSEEYELKITDRVTSVITNLGVTNAKVAVRLYEGSMLLSASCLPATASQEIAWSSNNKKVATVDENGLVTFLAAGKAVITAAAMDGTGKKATVTFIITK